MSFWGELKRRRVVRAALVYLVAAWAVIQVGDVVAPRIGLPDWTVTFVIFAAALGLPIALVFAWLYDLRPDPDRPASSVPVNARALAYLGIGILILFAGFAAYYRLGRPNKAPAAAQASAEHAASIAVLPFVNMSPDREQEYFSDGLTEELLNALSQLSALRVAARTSSFSFKGKNLPVGEIARVLNVKTVLEGSVRKAGNRVRITAQLINASDGYHLWSKTFDRELTDIFAVQDEIARAIVEALELELVGGAQPQVSRGGTANLSAHELYLLGLHHFARRTGPDMRRAIEVFSQAIAQDTTYALAYAGLAQTYAAASFYTDISLEESARLGRAAAVKALALDTTVAEAYAALGDILFHWDWDLAGSERMHRRALALKPSFAQAWDWLAEPLSAGGRLKEALDASRRMLELDPLGLRANSMYGFHLFQDGQYDAALEQLQRAMQIDSTNRVVQLHLIDVQFLRGRMDEAAAALRRFAASAGEEAAPLDLAARALIDRSLRPAALEALHHFQPGAWIYTRRLIAHLYVQLGDRKRALDYLDRMHAAHDGSMMFVIHDINLAALRGEPRFHALARKLGIEPPPPRT